MATHEGAPVAGEPVVSAGAYRFLAFMLLLNALNMLDRTLIGAFANDIKADLHLSNGQFGLLSGILFTLLYGLLSPIMGLITDVTHRPRFAALGVGLWSLLTAASGAATGFVSLAIPRVFIGVGESAITPVALSLLADRFPGRRLGFASGLYYAGVPLGSGLSFLVAGSLGPVIGWRNCFILIGALGVGLALLLATLRDPRARPGDAAGGAARAVRGMLALAPEFLAALRRSPALWLTMLGGAGLHCINGAAGFDALWWKEELHLATGPLFLKVAAMSAVLGIAGSLLGGLIGDWWLRTTGQGRPMMVAVMLMFLTPVGLLYRFTDHAGWIFWLGMGCRIFQGAAMYGAAFATVQELVPVRLRGTAVAVFILTINVVGVGISSTVAGYMIDAFAKAGDARPITHMMLILTLASAVAIPCFFFAARRFARDRTRLAAFEAARP